MAKKAEDLIQRKSGQIPILVQRKIREALNGVSFGTITIVVQDKHVIQIDKNEKIRLK